MQSQYGSRNKIYVTCLKRSLRRRASAIVPLRIGRRRLSIVTCSGLAAILKEKLLPATCAELLYRVLALIVAFDITASLWRSLYGTLLTLGNHFLSVTESPTLAFR